MACRRGRRRVRPRVRMMRIGCGDHCFEEDVTSDDAIARVAKLGFDTVDLFCMGDSRFRRPEDLRTDITGAAKRIRTLVDDVGLEVSDWFVVAWSSYDVMACN